jgi:hypothetical protein
MTMLGALTVFGWVIVIGLAVVVVGSIIYWVRPKSTRAGVEAQELADAEPHKRRDPPTTMGPH